MKDTATIVMERCDLLSNISEDSEGICRPYGSQSMREVNKIVSGWMHSAGMTTRYDAIGNLIGRYEGEGNKTLILGSHLDTVRDAGKYDGILGVMVAVASVQKLRGERLPFSVEVVAFADEEGLRFGTTYLGSSVYAGAFDEERLTLEDRNEVSLARAVRDFGGDPDALAGGGRGNGDLLGYCEVHIEQGPVLEQKDLPVGVVTGIQSQTRAQASFTGTAGHAGTVPMQGRKDALCAAAEFILEVERAAKAEPDSVATVGEIKTLPGASNVISGETRVSLDLRHPDDAAREKLRDHLEERAADIAASRNCGHSWEVRQENAAIPMDERLTDYLAKAMEKVGLPVCRIPSGAGHDAAQMASLTAPAMLFVRCEEGISHNPAESVTKEDVGVAIDVVSRFIELLAEEES
jgi:allantoate deiminase